jgi:hypothetical protein
MCLLAGFEDGIELWSSPFSIPSLRTQTLSPHHRFVIALHSPDGIAETGLRVRPPEKT